MQFIEGFILGLLIVHIYMHLTNKVHVNALILAAGKAKQHQGAKIPQWIATRLGGMRKQGAPTESAVTKQSVEADLSSKKSIGMGAVLNPCFSIREALKNLVLLEDHFSHPEKRCGDCITKHTLMIESYLLEALSLPPKSDTDAEKIKEINIPVLSEKVRAMLVKFNRDVLKQPGDNKRLQYDSVFRDLHAEARSIRKVLQKGFALPC